jgi:hypothetical protein
VTPELRAIIERVADDQGATISDVVLRYVIDRLVAEGYVREERTNERRGSGQPPVAANP